MCVYVCGGDHLCVYTLKQIYIIYTVFVLSFKIKIFLNKNVKVIPFQCH